MVEMRLIRKRDFKIFVKDIVVNYGFRFVSKEHRLSVTIGFKL